MLPKWVRADSHKDHLIYSNLVEQVVDATFVRERSGRIVYANNAMCTLSGYTRSELVRMHIAELYAMPLSDFHRKLNDSRNMFAFHGRQKFKHKSGKLLDVDIRARLIEQDLIGAVVQDLGERAELDNRLRSTAQLFSIMESDINDVLFSLTVEQTEQYRFRYANDAFYRATGLGTGQVVGKLVQEVIPEPSLSMVLEKYRQAINEYRSVQWDESSGYPTGRKYGQIRIIPVFDSQGVCTELVGRVRDITDRKLYEIRLERQKNLYDMLSQTNQAIVKLQDRDDLFLAVCRAAVQHGGLHFAAVSLLDPGTRQLHMAIKFGEDSSYLRFAQIFANPSDARGRGPAGEAVLTGKGVICNDFLNDPRTQPWWELARKAGIRSVAAFPIRCAGEIIGVLLLYASAPEFFVEEMLPTLREMANDVSFALDNHAHETERMRLGKERDQMVERIADGFLAVTRDWHVTYVNAAACELLGAEPTALAGKSIWTVVSQYVADKLRQACQIAMVMQKPASLEEYFAPTKSWFRINIYPSQEGLTIYLRNFTVQKLAEEKDRTHHEEMRKISQRLLEAQESERRNLARELHDEVGQCVNAINMKLHELGTLTKDSTQQRLIEEAAALTGELDEQIGQLSLNLHPSVLDDLGLQPAFQWCIRTRFGNDSKKIRLDVEPGLPRFDANVENVVFRVFQEALSNAFRHGGATQVNIALARENEELVLSISDNGHGFDLAAAMQAARAGKSLGLIGMQERARHAGGEISIQSEPGQGTRIELSLPATLR